MIKANFYKYIITQIMAFVNVKHGIYTGESRKASGRDQAIGIEENEYFCLALRLFL